MAVGGPVEGCVGEGEMEGGEDGGGDCEGMEVDTSGNTAKVR